MKTLIALVLLAILLPACNKPSVPVPVPDPIPDTVQAVLAKAGQCGDARNRWTYTHGDYPFKYVQITFDCKNHQWVVETIRIDSPSLTQVDLILGLLAKHDQSLLTNTPEAK